MRVAVFIASRSESAGPASLRNGDRAAVHWGVALAGADCRAQFPAGDQTAWNYAAAVGASCEPIDDRDTATFDIALIGPGAIDAFGDELAGRLSERLSAELLFGVLHLERQSASWKIVCDAGHGAREILRVAGPVVVVVSDDAERPPYVSRHRLTRAASGVSRSESVARPTTGWQAVTPRPPRTGGASNIAADNRADSIFGIAADAPDTRSKQTITAEPAVCAQVLLRYLLHHGFVTQERSRPGTISGCSPCAVTVPEVALHGAETSRQTARSTTAPASELSAAVRRRPRPVNAGLVPNRRGPFPVTSHPHSEN